MTSVVGLLDIVALAGFIASTILGLRWATARGRPARAVAILFSTAMALYAVVSLSNALEHLGVTSSLDPLEDYLELLFIPLIAYVTYAWAAEQQRSRLERANRLIRQDHELLSSVIENSPTGILLTDGSGRITFANDKAKEILDLGDPQGRAQYDLPTWRMRCSNMPEAPLPEPGIFVLTGTTEGAKKGVLCSLEWPDGRQRLLSVNVRPMTEESAESFVVSLEDVTYRKGLHQDA